MWVDLSTCQGSWEATRPVLNKPYRNKALPLTLCQGVCTLMKICPPGLMAAGYPVHDGCGIHVQFLHNRHITVA